MGSPALLALNNLPIGTILLWAGDVQHLPPGWYLCDGDHNTVDLLDRIPIGANQGQVTLGPSGGLRGANTGTGTHIVVEVKAQDGGGVSAWPNTETHTHPLPVNRVYFIQRVS